MSHHHRNDDDPIQDFIDLQENRYNRGYWVTEWYSKGRMSPAKKALQRANLSSLSRSLIFTVLIGVVASMAFQSSSAAIPHFAFWFFTAIAAVFFLLWYGIARAMKHSKKKDP